MTYRIQGERIAVRPDEKPQQIGSIVVAETVALIPTSGVIVQVGPQASYYEVGQRIAFAERAGTLAKIDGEVIRVLTPDEILCLIPEEANA